MGTVIFASLLLAVYGVWYFTNDQRVQRQAEQYLAKLTGAHVRVAAAEFHFLEGIKLTGVQVFHTQEGRREDLFEADEVYLEPRPLSLLTGRIEVNQIICVRPVVTLIQDLDHNSWNIVRLMPRGEPATSIDLAPRHLPVVLLRDGTIVRRNLDDSVELPVGQVPSVSARLAPEHGRPAYTFEVLGPGGQGGPEVLAQGHFDLQTGEYGFSAWQLLEKLDLALPQKYQQWRQRYNLTGKLQLTGESEGDPARPLWRARLDDAAIRLPPEEGGLVLEALEGELIFSAEGVRIVKEESGSRRGLQGRLPGLNGAAVRIDGSFEGYDASAAFELHVECDDLQLPVRDIDRRGLLAPLAGLQEELKPIGSVQVTVDVTRDAAGQLHSHAMLRPRKMQATLKGFPYRLDELEGEIELVDGLATIKSLRARHGPATIGLDGLVLDTRQFAGQVNIHAQNVQLDDDLRSALDAEARGIYDLFSPKGTCRIEATVAREALPGAQWQRRIKVQCDGRAEVLYRDFPYRLEALEGQLEITGRAVKLTNLGGKHGPASATLNGNIDFDKRGTAVTLALTATGVPMDEQLSRALPPAARASYDMFAPSGSVDVTGQFTRPADGVLDFALTATLKDATLCYAGFPYPVESTVGVLRITPRQVEIDRLQGQRGSARLTVSGMVDMERRPAGMDLKFQATDVSLDNALRVALPPAAEAAWQVLRPEGKTDAEVILKIAGGAANEPLDYVLTLQPTDMGVTYAGFPYPLRGLQGKVVARPGQVEIAELTGGSQESPFALSGVMRQLSAASGRQQWRADLKVSAKHVAINEQLLKALPPGLAAMTGGLELGGWCDVELPQFHYTWTPAMAGSPLDDGPAASQPQRIAQDKKSPWEIEGRLGFQQANVNLGMGARQMTGEVTGHASGVGREQVALEGELLLEQIAVDNRTLRKLSADLRTSADGKTLRLNDLKADVYGGRMVGQATLELQPPAADGAAQLGGEYRLALMVEDVELDALINDGLKDPAERVQASGHLAGRIGLVGRMGQVNTREATGQFQITRAKFQRLPVLLGLMNVVMLQVPGGNELNTGLVSYYLKGEKITFEEISLLGGESSLLGTGTLDLKTDKLALTFLSGPRGDGPLMRSILPDLIRAATGGFSRIRITGSLREPKVDMSALRDADSLLKEMLTPPQ